MKTSELLLSSLNITEDDYNYKGQFILTGDKKTLNVDITDLDNDSKLGEIKLFFNLEEEPDEIRRVLMDLIMEKATISSKFNEGQSYCEDTKRKKTEKAARSFDIA